MTLLRRIWRLLVGVKDALALLFLALFFVVLWGALQGRAPLTVPNDAALVLDLDGQIVDQANQRSLLAMFAGGDGIGRQIEVRNIIRAIDTARTNSRIKALVLNLDTFTGAGQANLQTIGRALTAFRAVKPVYAYATAYTDDGYYLAAHATQAWISPVGGVLLTGPGGTNLYFKTALDKLNIDVNVFRVGTYKSAVEPFTRSESSPEAKAASQALVDTLWAGYRADVAKVRPGIDLDAFLTGLPARVSGGTDFAQAAAQSKLVDKIGTRADFGRAMAAIVGNGKDDAPGNFNGVSLGRFLSATAPTRERGPAVGVVYVAGDIIDGDAPGGTAGGETIAGLIDEALANDDIKALVVRIDSPGGSVTASERIREALIEARGRKLPVVASFGSVAASGGYWVSTAAETVYAEPSTITGSIGVFAVIPSFNRALTKLGIGADGVKSTPFSGEPDVLRGLSPGTRELLQASVEDIYRRFTGLVAKARGLPVARVDEIGQGRVWAGSTAKTLGLVNHFGGLDDAVADAAKRAGLPVGVRTIAIEPGTPFPLQLLEGAFGNPDDEAASISAHDPFAKLVQRDRARLFAGLAQAQAIAAGPTIQAGCLDCAALLPPRGVAVAQGKAMLAGLMK